MAAPDKRIQKVLLLLTLPLLGAILLWFSWDSLLLLLSEPARLQAQVEELGAWGPLAVIGLGVLQVLVAPLPGYPIVFVSGLLFGGWAGAIYANVGMLIAGMLAMWLSRTYGRPLVECFVEHGALRRIEGLLASDSPWLWFFVLLLPTGDLPYFVAGLSRISARNFFLALFAARFPFTFVLTHAAAATMTLPPQSAMLLGLCLAFLGAVAYWQQERLNRWMHEWLERLAQKSSSQHET